MNNTPSIAIIAALDENNAIGRQGGLPWDLPEDLKHFRRVTMGRPVIMGRRTWESIGRPLPGREVIVWTSRALDLPQGVHRAKTQEQALELAYALSNHHREVIIAGGAGVYEAFLPLASIFHLTRVHATIPDADTFFPAWDRAEWQEEARFTRAADAANPYACTTSKLIRKQP